jgi:hypothetical protein
MVNKEIKEYQVLEGLDGFWIVIEMRFFNIINEFSTAAEAQELADELNGESE